MTAMMFYRRVMGEAALERDDAKRATAAVLHALRDRLTPEEARQAAAQLPRELKLVWRSGEAPRRRRIEDQAVVRRPREPRQDALDCVELVRRQLDLVGG